MPASDRVCRFLAAIGFCLTSTLAQAAGLRSIDIPADADGPAIHGMIWYPCAKPPGEVKIGRAILPGVQDCPLAGDHLPLIAASHGQGGTFLGNHDTAEALADNGFVVAAVNHPGDTAQDPSRSGDLSVFVERPTDIKRLIDFMIGASPFAARIDQDRIGFFGFSRGGYTGLVLLGANPDWAGAATNYCQPKAAAVLPTDPRQDIPVAAPHARSADQGRGACRSSGHLLLRGEPGASQGAGSTLGIGTGWGRRAAPRCRGCGRKPSGPTRISRGFERRAFRVLPMSAGVGQRAARPLRGCARLRPGRVPCRVQRRRARILPEMAGPASGVRPHIKIKEIIAAAPTAKFHPAG